MQTLILIILFLFSSYFINPQEDKTNKSRENLVEKLGKANDIKLINGFSVAVNDDKEILF